jgi:deoxyinosine 3'endonuclease (endonuclease V)
MKVRSLTVYNICFTLSTDIATGEEKKQANWVLIRVKQFQVNTYEKSQMVPWQTEANFVPGVFNTREFVAFITEIRPFGG